MNTRKVSKQNFKFGNQRILEMQSFFHFFFVLLLSILKILNFSGNQIEKKKCWENDGKRCDTMIGQWNLHFYRKRENERKEKREKTKSIKSNYFKQFLFQWSALSCFGYFDKLKEISLKMFFTFLALFLSFHFMLSTFVNG